MNIMEEAVIYATKMHSGKTRKGTSIPYIIHPMEVAQILSTMTDDLNIISAGVLHDIVEDTDGTLNDIRDRFGERVAQLVDSETENKYDELPKEESWKQRKTESLMVLKNSDDIGVKMLWLADKLSNIRSMARKYAESGDEVWNMFHQKDPSMHKWYYASIAQILEIDLNRTGAFKEYINQINYIWPGTFSRDKTYFKKYDEISIEGLRLIGKGSKSEVYRFDDELIVKVYKENNLFSDIEREYQLTKIALRAGIPTAIPFGIVAIGNSYGALYELIDSVSVSDLIKSNPEKIDEYVDVMVKLAWSIHYTDGSGMGLPDYTPKVYEWIDEGIRFIDEEKADHITEMYKALPEAKYMIHGDFHTGNVMRQKDEYLLIDLDRLSVGDPVIEISGMYMFYVAFGELDPTNVEKFMGFSYDLAKKYYDLFIDAYFYGYKKEKVEAIRKKCALLAYVRLVRRCYKGGTDLSEDNQKACDYYMSRINELLPYVTDFSIE